MASPALPRPDMTATGSTLLPTRFSRKRRYMPVATASPSPDVAQPTCPVLLEGASRQRETDAISFHFADLLTSRRCFLRAAWTLNRQGIVLLKQAASVDQINDLNRRIRLLLKDVKRYRTSGIDDIAYLNLPKRRVLKGYTNFVDADKAVINYRVKRPDGRSGSDAGMIDIFHPERLSPETGTLILQCLHEEVVGRLVAAACLSPVKVKCRNLYINNGVGDTRGYHCDGRSLKYKSFVYLSDVQSLDIGPYCYVKTSHRNKSSWKRSRQFNATHGISTYEYSQLQGETALPLFASAGDMILSSQRGAHRGHPQHPEASRTVLVNMYSGGLRGLVPFVV